MWPKVGYSIRKRVNDDHAKRQCGNILLIREIAIHRDEYVTDGCSPSHEFPILNAGPSEAAYRRDRKTDDLCRKRERQILVKKYAHRRAMSRVRRRGPLPPAL